MKAVGGIDALKKLTRREWLWCLDSTIREMHLEQEYRGLMFTGSTGLVPSPDSDSVPAPSSDGTKIDTEWEKRIEELGKKNQGEK